MKYRLKRILTIILKRSKLVNLCWQKIPNGVYVFNYHRIGEASKCTFERGIFSCDLLSLEQQLLLIKSHFKIISCKQLTALQKQKKPLQQRYALITFDDGYYDNFQLAFPLLKKLNITATFFITTNFVEQQQISWWDEIAYTLRQSTGEMFLAPFNEQALNITADNVDAIIKQYLHWIKRSERCELPEIINDLRKQFPQVNAKESGLRKPLFMEWQHVLKMQQEGMEIGSHCISHDILSHLNRDNQRKELYQSKSLIEEKLSTHVTAIAYPVGKSKCFNAETISLAEEVGYNLGFNNIPGYIKSDITTFNALNINRICIDSNDLVQLKISCILRG